MFLLYQLDDIVSPMYKPLDRHLQSPASWVILSLLSAAKGCLGNQQLLQQQCTLMLHWEVSAMIQFYAQIRPTKETGRFHSTVAVSLAACAFQSSHGHADLRPSPAERRKLAAAQFYANEVLDDDCKRQLQQEVQEDSRCSADGYCIEEMWQLRNIMLLEPTDGMGRSSSTLEGEGYLQHKVQEHSQCRADGEVADGRHGGCGPQRKG